jgi:hypothetical protein
MTVMTYIAALLDRGDKFRLAVYETASGEAAMQNAFASRPDVVLMVSTAQRAASAPKQEELFPLLLRRLAPVKLDGEWFKGSEELARRALLNALESANAVVVRWTEAQFSEWSVKNRAARERAERERAERERQAAEAARRHGFVYAFHYRCNDTEWMKVGMTSSADEAACWGRIRDYIKSHNLPRDGWSFVGFVACREPRELEQRLHRRLRPFRIQRGAARELFRCSIPMYAAILGQEGDFIIGQEPGAEVGAVRPVPSRARAWTAVGAALGGLINAAVILAFVAGALAAIHVALTDGGGAASQTPVMAPAPTVSRPPPPAAVSTAIRPRPATPYFRPPPPWAVEEPPAFPHGRQGPAVAGGAPRRNVGCGSWPVGSDADRDCLARRFGR